VRAALIHLDNIVLVQDCTHKRSKNQRVNRSDIVSFVNYPFEINKILITPLEIAQR